MKVTKLHLIDNDRRRVTPNRIIAEPDAALVVIFAAASLTLIIILERRWIHPYSALCSMMRKFQKDIGEAGDR
jgi:hypothetical protein